MEPLNDELRYRLLKRLEQNPGLTQRQLAAEMGMSLGKLNYCLKALIEKGWVKAGNFRRRRNKLHYAYLLTPQGVEAKARLTIRFLRRKLEEYETLQREIDALRQEVGELDASAPRLEKSNAGD